LDGWGVSNERRGNAIKLAKTPNYDYMLEKFPHCLLQASAEAVGLPKGLMGNSEVGHLTIGSGRAVIQKLTLISNTIHDGSFFKNPVLMEAIERAQRKGAALHLIGLVSDGCVHSSPDHLDGLLELARRNKIERLVVHPILDGRDTPPRSAFGFMKELEKKLAGLGEIGVVCGRYYAMDRDRRWERVERYWRALCLGDGEQAESATAAVKISYERGEGDEFVKPFIVSQRGIKDGDSVICFNFRPDRVRQISRTLTREDFDGFTRTVQPKIYYACMTEYDETLALPIAFSPSVLPSQDIENTLPQLLSCHHIGQFHTAETEKYAHITYFLNGGKEPPCEGEQRQLVESLKVATYDLAPEMQTPRICELACHAIRGGEYPFIVLNFANPDMVGHTGIVEAGVEAVESVDAAFQQLLRATEEAHGTLIITADHGNCEQMINLETGDPHTAHTTNPVPGMVASFQADDRLGLNSGRRLRDGTLADVAPTVLQIMGIDIPAEMTGKSLLSR
jgi:2,3-bisphosphoglycerate-independent phosphoglycerate mutase